MKFYFIHTDKTKQKMFKISIYLQYLKIDDYTFD